MKVRVTGDSMRWKKDQPGDENGVHHMGFNVVNAEYLRTWDKDVKKCVDVTEKCPLKKFCPRQIMYRRERHTLFIF